METLERECGGHGNGVFLNFLRGMETSRPGDGELPSVVLPKLP